LLLFFVIKKNAGSAKKITFNHPTELDLCIQVTNFCFFLNSIKKLILLIYSLIMTNMDFYFLTEIML
jgi:hypothetical protein